MNIWRQFNLENQSFLSDWQILYWQTGSKKRIQWYLIWQIFVIRQTTKINSMPNFHLMW